MKPASWITAALLALAVLPASAHEVDCKGRSGIDLARCERHQKMAAQCGAVSGEAHYACDREFIIANPLKCATLSGDDGRRCSAELAAVQACAPRPGLEFMRCVRDAAKAHPAGGE